MNLDDKIVLITGGTGTFGKRFAEFALSRFKIRKLIVFSRDELKQYEMQHSAAFRDRDNVRFFIGDVRDVDRLQLAFRDVDYVVHTAALKQIPVAEYNPFECIRTNVIGAENVVTAAMRTNVKRVIALSTDKAANPINLYGASKLAADKIMIAAKNLVGEGEPLFSVVRYGNVIGSRGSVIPLFRRMVREGADSIPITDPRMTRFWITATQGVEFVLSCFDMMRGGEIFVPKIPSMKVVDLADTIAPRLEQRTVGIRPGEKLHEVMITEDESRSTVELPDRYIICPTIFGEPHTYHSKQVSVAEGFRYSSDTNTDWLQTDQLLTMLEGIE